MLRDGASPPVDRIEVLPCLYRDTAGRIQEVPFPKGEPDPYGVPADLYCPSYEIRTSLVGPPKLGNLEVTIFNTRGYKHDPELEEVAKDHLVQAIESKEGVEVVQAAGGPGGIKQRILVYTFWLEP